MSTTGSQSGTILTAVSSVASETPTRTHRRRPHLFPGLVVIVVASGGYLGWQHFSHSPGAAKPQPEPPVPVIAATVQQQNFPIVLTGIGNVTALNTATVRSMVTEQIVSVDFKDGQFVKKGDALGATRSEHLSGAARPGGGQSRPRPVPPRKWANQPQTVYPAAKTRVCTGAAGGHSGSEERPDPGHAKGRSGGDRICQDRAELYQAGGAVRRGRRNSPARCRQHHPLRARRGVFRASRTPWSSSTRCSRSA